MQENISIDKENKKVYLLEEMFLKIKNIIKGLKYFNDVSIDENIDYYDFRYVIVSIIDEFKMKSDIMLKIDKDLFDIDLYNELQDLYRKFLQLSFVKENADSLDWTDVTELEWLINIVTQIRQTEVKMYLLRDLINAKNDYIKDMQYFMNNERIDGFNREYSQAIKEKNTDKMFQMLNQVQQLILKEWENFIGDIDTMSADNFCFLGHSTDSTRFDEKFNSRYVSCSLFDQDVNDTYRSRFGFIMPPVNIVGADSRDMLVNNYADSDDDLLRYSSIRIIHHPQRIIDECLAHKQENKKQNKQKKVYNEVVIDGFNPIGIFCFTNGAKCLDSEYEKAMKLQESFPNLKVKTFDLMKFKDESELADVQLNLINSLRFHFTGSFDEVKMKDLSRYEIFLKKFEELKKSDNYSEEDVEGLYKYNLKLLSIDCAPNRLFDGNFTDEEIKFILGRNPLYNIDFILVGNITPFSIRNLEKLSHYSNNLNKYYDGLSEFVDLITRVEINDIIIDEMKKESPTNFYKMSKIVLNNIFNSLGERQNDVSKRLDNDKKRYYTLKEEQKARKEIEEKYNLYSEISSNQFWYDMIQKDFNNLEEEMASYNNEECELLEQKEQIEKKINDLESINGMDLSQNYQSSPEGSDIQNRINGLQKQLDSLKRHPILNFKKIRTFSEEIANIKSSYGRNEEMFEKNKMFNIANRDKEIDDLKFKLRIIEDKLINIKNIKGKNQEEMSNLNQKIFEYFGCNSITEVSERLREAKEFLDGYEFENKILLLGIEQELQEIEQRMLSQESELKMINEEREKFSKY